MKERLNANAQAVLDVIKIAHNHPTATDIYEAAKKIRPHIGLASVYRILHTLIEQKYIKEIRHNDDACRYDAHTERHDHAICTECGTLIDIPIGVKIPEHTLESAAKAAGIELRTYELRLYGICPACSQKKQESA